MAKRRLTPHARLAKAIYTIADSLDEIGAVCLELQGRKKLPPELLRLAKDFSQSLNPLTSARNRFQLIVHRGK